MRGRRGRGPIPLPDVCDGVHTTYLRCTDPGCYVIPRQCPGDVPTHGERCLDPNCTNVRGWNEMVQSMTKKRTLKQFRDRVYYLTRIGPPGTDQEKELQRKRFNQEAAELVTAIIEGARPLVEDFINRWRTQHMPGQP